jgi:hypothetical protein
MPWIKKAIGIILKLDSITKMTQDAKILSSANCILTPNIIVGLVSPTKSGSEFMLAIVSSLRK